MKDKIVVGFVGLLGGVLGSLLVTFVVHDNSRAPAAQNADASGVVTAQRIRMVDAKGKTRSELGFAADGGFGLFFYDTQGRNRLVLGLYRPGESESPFVVLNDTKQSAVGIFRVFGEHESPVLVLKNNGQDRSVYGLNPSSLEPFLVNYSAGKKTALFGTF